MKRKLQLKKETLRTLSAEHLQQVASGSAGASYDTCDAPMVMGSGATLLCHQPLLARVVTQTRH